MADVMFCKVPYVQSWHESKMADTLQSAVSGPDFTRIIYAVSKFHGVIVWYVPGAVYEGYARAEKPVGLPDSVVTSGEFQLEMASKRHW